MEASFRPPRLGPIGPHRFTESYPPSNNALAHARAGRELAPLGDGEGFAALVVGERLVYSPLGFACCV